jgi:hypothetical protein
MQPRHGNLIIADQVRSTRHARHLGITTGKAGPRKRPRDTVGEPRRKEETEAGGLSILSQVVSVSSARVEQAGKELWGKE